MTQAPRGSIPSRPTTKNIIPNKRDDIFLLINKQNYISKSFFRSFHFQEIEIFGIFFKSFKTKPLHFGFYVPEFCHGCLVRRHRI